MIKKGIISLFILMCTFFAFGANAQVREGDVTISSSPSYPAPNENVTISINSFVTDLNKAFITWSINNEEAMSGIGKKTFSLNAGVSGSVLIIKANIDTVSGQNVSKNITISPAEVDMLWEAYDSYTPPFYKGKALVPQEGTFKIVAMPNIKNQNGNTNPVNMSYTWSKDGKVLTDSSGWGKNYYIFKTSFLDKKNEVKVLTSNVLGNIATQGKTTIEVDVPKIIFYQKDSFLGTRWEHSVRNNFKINTEGETLVAEPYFFSFKDVNNPDFAFSWTLNNTQIQTPTPKNTLSVKLEKQQKGNAEINVNIKNMKTLFQNLSKKLNVTF